MPEDNVVRPAFGGRKVAAAENEVSISETTSPADEASDFEQDVIYCLSNLELVLRAHLRGDEMTNYLFDEVGYRKTDSSLDLRRPVVRGNSFEQFCDHLLGSARAQWRAQPAFYGALFIEFHERQNLILASIGGRQEQVRALAGENIKILLQIAVRAEL